jgi:hypothetical protein
MECHGPFRRQINRFAFERLFLVVGPPPPVLRTRHFLHSIGQVRHHRDFPDFPRADRLPTRFADLALRGATDFLFLPIGL